MSDPSPFAIESAIRAKASELGFERVGFCDATPPEEARHFDRWLAAGMHATMNWLERGRDRRLDPRLVLEGARSMIVVALSYAVPGSATARPPLTTDVAGPRGTIARYALGDDYHRVVGERLVDLEDFIEASAPGHRALSYVDTGPVLERMWAARAGVGWVGKNSLILNKEMGSFFFLGVIITTLPLAADEAALDQCGSCTLCLEACPTGAIVAPRIVDSRRCISFQTIEQRGPMPREHRAGIGDRVFGCDDCQDVCPWNRRDGSPEPPTDPRDFPPRPDSTLPSLLELLAMTHERYLDRFRGSAVKRATYRGLRRNAAVVLGNRADDDVAIEALEAVARDVAEDPVVREQAEWSAARARTRLSRR